MSIAFNIAGMAGAAGASTTFAAGTGGINISTASGAQGVLGSIDDMIKVVDSKRADLGAVQNRRILPCATSPTSPRKRELRSFTYP